MDTWDGITSQPEGQQPSLPGDTGDLTQLLNRLAAGEKGVEQEVFELVFAELKRIAASKLRKERQGHTLQPTALVNEAYLKLLHRTSGTFKSRAHFLAIAGQAMRRILTDHGRAHRAKKRDGFSNAVPLDQGVERKSPVESSEIDDLNDAVDRLAKINPMAAKVVEMQYFAGLTQEEIAHLLGVSSRTVKRKWAFAQAWLKQEMTQ